MAENLHQELNQDVPISQMITSLREEIAAARSRAEENTNGLRFPIREVEVELSVKITKGKSGKLNVAVVQGDFTRSAETLHKFRIKMDVEDDAGGPVEVSKQRQHRPG